MAYYRRNNSVTFAEKVAHFMNKACFEAKNQIAYTIKCKFSVRRPLQYGVSEPPSLAYFIIFPNPDSSMSSSPSSKSI